MRFITKLLSVLSDFDYIINRRSNNIGK